MFRSLKWLTGPEDEHLLVLSSRTDAGVHVRINGGIVDLDRSLWRPSPRKMIRAVDDRLDPSAVFLTVEEVTDFNPAWPSTELTATAWATELWIEPNHEDFRRWFDLRGTHTPVISHG